MNYDQIRALSEELGRPISTLIVLDQYNDPFYIGPRRKERAEWFAQIWHDLKIPIGWHYRRIHYRMISQDPPLRFHPEGVYQNTMECWVALNNAARDAVYLGLVPLESTGATPNRFSMWSTSLSRTSPGLLVTIRGWHRCALVYPVCPTISNCFRGQCPNLTMSNYEPRSRQ